MSYDHLLKISGRAGSEAVKYPPYMPLDEMPAEARHVKLRKKGETATDPCLYLMHHSLRRGRVFRQRMLG